MKRMVMVMVIAELFPLLFVAISVGLVWLFRKRTARRSPINTKLINLPGEQLRQRMATLDERLSEGFLFCAMAGLFLPFMWMINRLPASLPVFQWRDLTEAVVSGAMFAYGTYVVMKTAKARAKVSQGYKAELATAQHLNEYVSKGCMVFHDVPGDNFNLDHVVISPHAVYVFETKSRMKPLDKSERSFKVRYDGCWLHFPEWRESEPLKQADDAARWLSQYLKSATGLHVPVMPVLALPGWWVDDAQAPREARVRVVNGKNPTFLLGERSATRLDDGERRLLARAIWLRYPDLSV